MALPLKVKLESEIVLSYDSLNNFILFVKINSGANTPPYLSFINRLKPNEYITTKAWVQFQPDKSFTTQDQVPLACRTQLRTS